MSTNCLERRTVRPWLHRDAASNNRQRRDSLRLRKHAQTEHRFNQTSVSTIQWTLKPLPVQALRVLMRKELLDLETPQLHFWQQSLTTTTQTPKCHNCFARTLRLLSQHCFVPIMFGLHLAGPESSLYWPSAMYRHTDPDFQLAANHSDPL